jgi:hypothetical protein
MEPVQHTAEQHHTQHRDQDALAAPIVSTWLCRSGSCSGVDGTPARAEQFPGFQGRLSICGSTERLLVRTTDPRREGVMKFVCLGYIEEKKWEGISEDEQNAMMDECFAYDDVLRKNGHFAGGEALQGARSAATLRYRKGKVIVTDGPYAETKEQLGGILILEADDLKHAIQLMSKHPGVRTGPFEIRPAADLAEFIRESERRRSAKKG